MKSTPVRMVCVLTFFSTLIFKAPSDAFGQGLDSAPTLFNHPIMLVLAEETSNADTETKTTQSSSESSEADLAKQLQNPVADLISVPFQNNVDFGIGPNNGYRYLLNVQPVVPISLSSNWNVISRTILPFIYQNDVIGKSSQGGLSDLTESLFFSPKKPGPHGLIWGVGPVFLLPSATDNRLGTEKWGAGPTAVLLEQQGPWTYGILANHIWSFAGTQSRAGVNSTFLQPFLTFTTKKSTTFGANTESTYDWQQGQWTVPVNVFVSQLVKVGKLPVSFTVGGRYYAEKPEGGPDWGIRFVVTLLFPTHRKD